MKSIKRNAEYSVCAIDTQFNTFCCQNNFIACPHLFLVWYPLHCFLCCTFQRYMYVSMWIQVNNGFYMAWSPSLTKYIFIELLMINRDWQFIHLSIGRAKVQVTGQKNETFGGYVLRPKMMNKTCCG